MSHARWRDADNERVTEQNEPERSGKSINLNRTQTILLAIIAGCLLVLVFVQVILPAIQESQRQEIQRTFDEISSGLNN